MDGFSSVEELYNRVKPALKSKLKDLTRIGINYVQEVDIFNYLKSSIWAKRRNLTLGEIVNDIMTVENSELESYVQSLIAKGKRTIDTEEVIEKESETTDD